MKKNKSNPQFVETPIPLENYELEGNYDEADPLNHITKANTLTTPSTGRSTWVVSMILRYCRFKAKWKMCLK
jgi:hypothetical protein